jgi:hypothetical protein
MEPVTAQPSWRGRKLYFDLRELLNRIPNRPGAPEAGGCRRCISGFGRHCTGDSGALFRWLPFRTIYDVARMLDL